MKKLLYTAGILCLFIIMLLFPKTTIEGARQGLLLWFQVLIPTLLPFMMISRLLIKTNIVSVLSGVLYPIFGRLFGTTATGAYCILIGFLCGYPMGAKTISDLYEEKALSKSQAEYLLCFCNNVSPGFVSGFLVISCLHRPELLAITLVLLYGVPMMFSIPLRIIMKPSADIVRYPSVRAASFFDIRFYDINDMMLDSFLSITTLGGYVILFRIFSQFLLLIPGDILTFFDISVLKNALAGVIEITSGIPLLAANMPSFEISFVLIITCTAFGGLSGIAQTYGIVKKEGLSILKYTVCKILQAVLAGVGAFLYIF